MVQKKGQPLTVEEQCRLWAIEGKSIHNSARDECCPDFSCCTPELLAPKEDRLKFYQAELKGDTTTMNKMLGCFLGKLVKFKFPDKQVKPISKGVLGVRNE